MAIPLRRSVTLAAAVATAAALGTGAVVLALPAAAEGAPPMTLVDGRLDWGIKQSFRSYLAMPFAHGRITVQGVPSRPRTTVSSPSWTAPARTT